MITAQLTNRIYSLTQKKDLEKSLEVLLPDYLKLKTFFIKQEIMQFEMKWNMTYEEFEKNSTNMPNGFSYETEQIYYDWGEKVALLQHYQEIRKEWY